MVLPDGSTTHRVVDDTFVPLRRDSLTQDEHGLFTRREAIGYMKTHPLQTLTLMPKKLVALFDHGGGVFWNIISTGNKSILARRVL
jgi:hypothetical protein